MDGTLVNYNERLYEEIQNSNKIPQEIKETLFDIKNRKHIDLSLSIDYKQTNITREKMINILNNIRQTTTFFKSLSFRPEVISTLKELNEIFDIHFVSKPSEKVASQSEHIKAKLIYDSL
jgi:5'(3')-deoxyribonucleotidase